MIFFLCLYIYNKIKIKQAALSWLKLPVRFPARNDSNGRGLSICLQSGLFAFRIRKGLAYLIQKALLNNSSTASVSSTTECRSPRNPFFFKSSLFSSSPFFHSSFSSTCHCLEICLAPFFDYWRINSLPLLSLLLEVQSFKWNPKNGKSVVIVGMESDSSTTYFSAMHLSSVFLAAILLNLDSCSSFFFSLYARNRTHSTSNLMGWAYLL